jgi:hypothetical protein
MSVEKISRFKFFFSGSFEELAIFIVVELYRSPKPLTKIFPEPSCFVIPLVLVTAVATSLTPFLANSCEPMLCFISTAFSDPLAGGFFFCYWRL